MSDVFVLYDEYGDVVGTFDTYEDAYECLEAELDRLRQELEDSWIIRREPKEAEEIDPS